jgi:hypothetical protein
LTIDLNHASRYVPGRAGPAVSLGEEINSRIDAGLAEARARECRRTYLGASMLADPCARRVAYEYRGVPDEPLDGRALRIFAAGHVLEDLLARWIRNAGFDLITVDPRTGGQFAFADGPIEGHADGVITGGPELGFAYPVLWEVKGLNDRSWSDLVKNGLRPSNPLYYGQVNLYMAYLGLDACLFSALNKNTCEIYHEIAAFDLAEAQRLVDRAVRIARGWLPPRIGLEPARYCDYCKFKTACWGLACHV